MVDNNLQSSTPDVFEIGECASWKGNYYVLIAPGTMTCFSHGIETDANLIDSQNGAYPLVHSIRPKQNHMRQGR